MLKLVKSRGFKPNGCHERFRSVKKIQIQPVRCQKGLTRTPFMTDRPAGFFLVPGRKPGCFFLVPSRKGVQKKISRWGFFLVFILVIPGTRLKLPELGRNSLFREFLPGKRQSMQCLSTPPQPISMNKYCFCAPMFTPPLPISHSENHHFGA